ncbi:hypothetical protein GGX14DRAFT_351940 [Mycena pura]|uniref:Survival Motor Neuron Gemin2-binding domain-containing protein n=1 Tax=Mycena pura TaxID=153505 RepID=A0AAD7E0X1_9AGAR|nr:hypothetical protein GGX14DRAFT_351940 [Mycena pura]
MQRPLISYDDITLPYEQQATHERVANSPSNTSHSKKRKWSSQKPTQHQKSSKSMKGPAAEEEADEEEDLDSRLLASEEIWDDSALIDAWDAAMEEYEALNGPDKGWKNEPVHKSPLWYNVPPSKPPKKKIKTADATAGAGVDMEEEGDSNPIDFATFVPTHDASLAPPARAGDAPSYDFGALPSGALTASQDEAFERALNATYWGGYWTAVYHCHRRTARPTDAEAERESEYGDEDGENVDDGTGDKESEQEEFVPTQR